MGARPGNWDLLDHDRDPVGGDPDSVDTESAHYGAVADDIRAQVVRLRRLANEPDLLGQYANTLRSSAGELATKLDKTAGRYQAVGNALHQWRPHLDDARAGTARALADAVEAQSRVTANATAVIAADPVTAEQQEAARLAEQRRTALLESAQADLHAARRRCVDALHERDRQARIIKNVIKDAIDDDVRDSMWDNVKDYVDKHAKAIAKITEVLSWAATILAVVALVIPGLNLIALAAIGLTVLVLAGHATLAATDNGSWADVALDVFALATFGAGKVASGGIIGHCGRIADGCREGGSQGRRQSGEAVHSGKACRAESRCQWSGLHGLPQVSGSCRAQGIEQAGS